MSYLDPYHDMDLDPGPHPDMDPDPYPDVDPDPYPDVDPDPNPDGHGSGSGTLIGPHECPTCLVRNLLLLLCQLYN